MVGKRAVAQVSVKVSSILRAAARFLAQAVRFLTGLPDRRPRPADMPVDRGAAQLNRAEPTREAALDEPISDMLRRCRLNLGLSQNGLANELAQLSGNPGVTRTHVARWERGMRVPGPYWRPWLSAALGLPDGVLADAAATAHNRTPDR